MSETPETLARDPNESIRIVRLNTEKTRKDNGSDTVYHVYFELSVHPTSGWRSAFGGEWSAVNKTPEPVIDGGFLVVHCPLDEVASSQLPQLKKIVASTNAFYKQNTAKEAADVAHRVGVWKNERKDVETMAATLRFD
jgi:hypothetical protein